MKINPFRTVKRLRMLIERDMARSRFSRWLMASRDQKAFEDTQRQFDDAREIFKVSEESHSLRG